MGVIKAAVNQAGIGKAVTAAPERAEALRSPADAALVERCLAGEPAAQVALYRRHVDAVYRLALWLLGDPHEAEDLAQDVFVQTFRVLERYDPARAPFGAWLRAITVNRCRNARRRHRPVQVSWEEALGAAPDDPGAEADLRQALWAGLERLTEKQRAAVVLRYFEGLSFAEIAATLRCPVGTAASRVAEGLAALRRVLPDELP